jgi:hypothetical protein
MPTRTKRIPKDKTRVRVAKLGWFEDAAARPWTVTATPRGLRFRRYSSPVFVTVSIEDIFALVVMPRLPSKLLVLWS